MSFIPLPVPISSQLIKRHNLEVYYPLVTGLSNRFIEIKVNNIISTKVNDLIFKQGYNPNADMEMKGSYEIKTNERNILSLTLINDIYTGGAHSYTVIEALTFDMNTGELVAFEDLFKKGSPYIKELSEIVSEQIKERGIPLLGGFERIEPNQSYYVADKSLVLFYELYEMSPYAQGFPAFPISLYEIKDLIGDKSILRRMTTFY